jgi:GNAT superfamily N-acetyltransferase
MAFDVRPVGNLEEFGAAFLAIGQYFGATIEEERMQRWVDQLGLDRMHAAFSDGAIVGGAAAFTFNMTVPGGDVPTAGVSVVGVYPTHRRRGILRSLMHAQLDDVHERGEPMAALWASEEPIYSRFGYGLAGFCGEISLAHEYTAFADSAEPAGTFRFLEPDAVLEEIPPVFEQIRLQWPGMFSRNRLWWEQREVEDPQDRRDGAGPKRWIAYEREGSLEGSRSTATNPAGSMARRSPSYAYSRRWAARRRQYVISGASCSRSTGRRRSRPGSFRPTIRSSCC